MISMNLPLNEVQKAIYDTVSQAVSCEVYDAVPPNATMPYVKIGEVRVLPSTNKTTFGVEIIETIHVWSQYAGFSEINGIMDGIVAAFDLPLAVVGYEVVLCGLNNAKTLTDPDGRTRHGVVDLRFVVYRK